MILDFKKDNRNKKIPLDERTVRIVILTEAKRKRIIELSRELNELVKVLEDKSNVSEGTLQRLAKGRRRYLKQPLSQDESQGNS